MPKVTIAILELTTGWRDLPTLWIPCAQKRGMRRIASPFTMDSEHQALCRWWIHRRRGRTEHISSHGPRPRPIHHGHAVKTGITIGEYRIQLKDMKP